MHLSADKGGSGGLIFTWLKDSHILKWQKMMQRGISDIGSINGLRMKPESATWMASSRAIRGSLFPGKFKEQWQ